MNAFPDGGIRQRHPEVYVPGVEIAHIYAIALDAAVGSFDIGNTPHALRFENDALSMQPLGFSVPEGLDCSIGEIRNMPAGSRACAYTQSRRLLRLDFDARTVTRIPVCRNLSECIEWIWPLDASMNAFVACIETIEGIVLRDRSLVSFRIVDGQALQEGASYRLSRAHEPVLCVGGDTVFLYEANTHELRALDGELREVPHGLCALWKEKRDTLRRISALAVHPTLPFALIVDRSPLRNENYLLHVAVWEGDSPRIVPLPGPGLNSPGRYYSGMEFSPDGRWAILRDESEDDMQPVFMALPVLPDSPVYVGMPLTLGSTHGGATGASCWSSNPTAFVACDGAALYRWILE